VVTEESGCKDQGVEGGSEMTEEKAKKAKRESPYKKCSICGLKLLKTEFYSGRSACKRCFRKQEQERKKAKRDALRLARNAAMGFESDADYISKKYTISGRESQRVAKAIATIQTKAVKLRQRNTLPELESAYLKLKDDEADFIDNVLMELKKPLKEITESPLHAAARKVDPDGSPGALVNSMLRKKHVLAILDSYLVGSLEEQRKLLAPLIDQALVDVMLNSSSDKARVAASKELLDRVEGRPVQRVDQHIVGIFGELDTEELKRRIREKMEAGLKPRAAIDATYTIVKDRRWFSKKKDAKRRGIDFDFSIPDFAALLEGDSCYYCGADSTWQVVEADLLSERSEWNPTPRTAYRLTVERLDDTKGYTPENCVLACSRCNTIKNQLCLTSEDMILLGPFFRLRAHARLDRHNASKPLPEPSLFDVLSLDKEFVNRFLEYLDRKERG